LGIGDSGLAEPVSPALTLRLGRAHFEPLSLRERGWGEGLFEATHWSVCANVAFVLPLGGKSVQWQRR